MTSDSPETIAVVGASTDRNKFGNKAVRAYRSLGWTVYPIHPKQDTIEGLKAYRSLNDVPRPIHRISMYVPPAIGLKLLDDITTAEPDDVYFNPGSESPDLIDKARALGLNVIVACSIVDVGLSPSQFPSTTDPS